MRLSKFCRRNWQEIEGEERQSLEERPGAYPSIKFNIIYIMRT
ncbi:Uncharacterised protein [Serratia ficaria]|nr:Uncharacterised protein [Serratia ficaria]VVA46832.1 hypothetical protein SERVES_00535 [Serratia ficaria]